jgi:peptide/nickel transport system ATP-binding protein
MPEPLLEIEDLSLSFVVGGARVPALKDFNLTLHRGEVVGLVGESGSGKSTALFAVMRYLPANAIVEAGRIRFRGDDLLGEGRAALDRIRGRRIAMIYQDPATALNPAMVAGAQIVEVLRRHFGMNEREARARTLELLGLVEFDDPASVYHSYPHQLSGGMRQRVVIAMALAGDPDILLMDEPTTALDVIVQARILALVRALRRRLDAAILFVSHDLGAVAQLADRIAVLYAGELMEIGPAARVIGAPQNPYTRGLVAAIPQIARRAPPQGISGSASTAPGRFAHCVFAERCAYAADVCRAARPPLVRLGASVHSSRCHFAAEPERLAVRPIASAVAAETSAPSAPVLLDVSALSVDYRGVGGFFGLRPRRPIRAVSNVSFRLSRGRVLAIVGESGSGKSTLARTLLRLERKAAGRIVFDGKDVFELDAGGLRIFRRSAQIVFQNPTSSLNPRKTVAALVGRPLALAGIAPHERQNRIRAALQAVGLTDAYLQRYPGRLSGGEKQRVALARAFVVEPLLVILDEPTTALDVSVQATILELLLRQKERTGCAYLLISHDLAVVRQVADDVLVMRYGEECESGPIEQVFRRPSHPYTAELIAAVSRLEGSARLEE